MIFVRENRIFTNSKNKIDSKKEKIVHMRRPEDYKQEITFLIDKQCKIYYNPKDLFHKHEDLIIENQVNEKDVCRLVYDPNQAEDTSFCGIGGVFASCNILFNNLPFELKSTHLNAIETWLKDYDEIVKYANKNPLPISKKPDFIEEHVNLMNNLYLAAEKLDLHPVSLKCVYSKWNTWKEKFSILKWLNEEEEVIKLRDSGLLSTNNEEDLREYLEDCKRRAQNKFEVISIQRGQSCIEETPIEINAADKKIIKIEQKLDLARFLELSNEIIQETNMPGSIYFTIGAKLLYGIIIKIAERSIALNDSELIKLLEKIKMIERDDKEERNE